MKFPLYFILTFILFPAICFAQGDDENEIRIQLKPSKEARILSPMTGKIIEVKNADGDAVKKGSNLVVFDCKERQSSLAQLKARLKKQTSLYESTRKLHQLGSASKTDLSVLKAEYDEAVAAKNNALAQVDKCRVRSPFLGKISALHVQNYYSVKEGDPLIEVISDDKINIEMIVPSKWIKWLKKDYEFKVHIDETDTEYVSKVTRIGGKVDPVTQSVKLYAVLVDKAPELLSGMSGKAIFDHVTDSTQTEAEPQKIEQPAVVSE